MKKDKEYYYKFFMRKYISNKTILDKEIEDFELLGEKNYRLGFSYGVERKLGIDMFESLEMTEGIVKAIKELIKKKEVRVNEQQESFL